MLYREPKLLKFYDDGEYHFVPKVSVLYREPKLLKSILPLTKDNVDIDVSVLYREPKLLK